MSFNEREVIFQQQTSENYVYAREHRTESVFQVQCVLCGELYPHKIVTSHPGLTSFFCEPTCDCGSTKEVNYAEI
jgi:hypothetical protein